MIIVRQKEYGRTWLTKEQAKEWFKNGNGKINKYQKRLDEINPSFRDIIIQKKAELYPDPKSKKIFKRIIDDSLRDNRKVKNKRLNRGLGGGRVTQFGDRIVPSFLFSKNLTLDQKITMRGTGRSAEGFIGKKQPGNIGYDHTAEYALEKLKK